MLWLKKGKFCTNKKEYTMNKNGYLSLLLFLSSTCGVLGANQLTQEHQHHLFNLLASGLNLPSLSPQAKVKLLLSKKNLIKTHR